MKAQDSRRQFLQKSLFQTALVSTIGPAAAAPNARSEPAEKLSTDPTVNSEWRNKQPGMTYRRLGRTNLMISEIIAGEIPSAPAIMNTSVSRLKWA